MAAFHYKSCYDAITKYKQGEEDSEKLMQLCDWLTSFRRNGAITDAQVHALADYLGVEVDVPDAPDTYESTIAAVQQDVSDLLEGVAELGEIVSGIIDPEQEQE